MAVGPIGNDTAENFANNLSVAKPAGTAEGHLILIPVLLQSSTGTVTSGPSGFTLEDSDVHGAMTCYLYSKIAGASEPSSYSISLSGFHFVQMGIEVWDVGDFASPISDIQQATATDSLEITSTDVATLGADGAFLHILYERDSGGPVKPSTIPSGYTQRIDNGYSGNYLGTYSKLQAVAGQAGALTWEHSAVEHDAMLVYSLALDETAGPTVTEIAATIESESELQVSQLGVDVPISTDFNQMPDPAGYRDNRGGALRNIRRRARRNNA